MFPDRVPDDIRRNEYRRAEVDVYDTLAAELDGRFTVFAWTNLLSSRSRSARESEVDFLVLDPARGFLVLEVKGGAVSRDAGTGQWTSRSFTGDVYPIKDPFDQARQARHDVDRKLQELPSCQNWKVPGGYGVILPDSSRPAFPLAADANAGNTVFADDMPRLAASIDAMFDHWNMPDALEPPGAAGAQRFRDAFGRSFQLRLPLGALLRPGREQIAQLTERQFVVTRMLDSRRRVLIEGGAGTGKTCLALDKALRLARDGARTLLTCFNRPLADHLRQAAGEHANLEIATIHQLYYRWALRAGLDVKDPDAPGADSRPDAYFTQMLPAAFETALDRLRERFDAIVVDEGQDFGARDREAMEFALAEPGVSTLYVFQDPGQSIYHERKGWPADTLDRYELDENLRNSRGIHAALITLSAAHAKRAGGPEGPLPECIAVRDDAQMRRELSRCLHRLIHEEAVEPAAIAVLTGSRREFTRVVEDGRIGAYETTHDHAGDPRRVLVDSISRFKGLERDIVILTALESPAYTRAEELFYVGASRACLRLFVIEREELLERFRGGVLPPG